MQKMRSDSNMTDFALTLRFLHTFVHSGAVTRTIALSDHMELMDINVVGLQLFK